MTEILTESFCERCGTRYTFESARKPARLKGVRVLSRGLKNFVLSDGTTMDEAMAAARSETDREVTSHQLDAFHKTFNFCMTCRQYTCPNCWNEVEARCLTCAPHLGHEIMPAPFPDLSPSSQVIADPFQIDTGNGSNGIDHGYAAAEAASPADMAEDDDLAARLDMLMGTTVHVEAPTAPEETPAIEEVEPVQADTTDAWTPGTAFDRFRPGDDLDAELEAYEREHPAGLTSESAPIDTAEPEVVAEPVVASEPEMVAEPETAAESQAVAEPEAIVAPEPAAEPEVRGRKARWGWRLGRPTQEAVAEPEAVAATEVAPASEQVATAAEPEPEFAAEPLPTGVAEAEAEIVVAAQPEPEPTVVAEPEPVVAPEPEAEVVAAEPEPEFAPEPEPIGPAEAEAEIVVAAQPEPEPIVASEREPLFAAEPEPEVVVAAEPEPEPAMTAEPVVATEPEVEVVVATEADAEFPAVAEPEPEPVVPTEPEPQPVLAAEPGPEPVAAAEPESVVPLSAPVVDDVVPQPTWRRVAPDDTPAPPVVPPAAPSVTIPTAARVADPTGEPQWPERPAWLADRPSTGLPFLGRAATPQGGLEALWAESNREVVAPVSPGRASGGVQPCVSCGLSLSATARFCRRCGTSQPA